MNSQLGNKGWGNLGSHYGWTPSGVSFNLSRALWVSERGSTLESVSFQTLVLYLKPRDVAVYEKVGKITALHLFVCVNFSLSY